MVAGVSPESVPPLADAGNAHMAHLRIPEIDYQAISYYADPTKKKEGPKSLDEVDPELLKTFDKLGIPLEEQKHLSGTR